MAWKYAVASPQLSFNETKSFDLFDKKIGKDSMTA